MYTQLYVYIYIYIYIYIYAPGGLQFRFSDRLHCVSKRHVRRPWFGGGGGGGQTYPLWL